MRTEGTDMATVIVAFRNFANLPKKEFSVGYIGVQQDSLQIVTYQV